MRCFQKNSDRKFKISCVRSSRTTPRVVLEACFQFRTGGVLEKLPARMLNVAPTDTHAEISAGSRGPRRKASLMRMLQKQREMPFQTKTFIQLSKIHSDCGNFLVRNPSFTAKLRSFGARHTRGFPVRTYSGPKIGYDTIRTKYSYP